MYIIPGIPKESLASSQPTAVEHVKRASSTIARLFVRATTKCKSDVDVCEMPNNTTTLTIVLCTVIPIVAVAIMVFILHRRLVNRQKKEDAEDKLKELDFGIGPSDSDSAGDIEVAAKKRGMSMDMLASSYLVPPDLQTSQDSIHSIPRSVIDANDPYRQVHLAKEDRTRTMKSDSASTNATANSAMDSNLLQNAQEVPRSKPPRSLTASPVPPIYEAPTERQTVETTARVAAVRESSPVGAAFSPIKTQFAGDDTMMNQSYTINDYYRSYDAYAAGDDKHASDGKDSLVPSDDLDKFPDTPSSLSGVKNSYVAYKPGSSPTEKSFDRDASGGSSDSTDIRGPHVSSSGMSDYNDLYRTTVVSAPRISVDYFNEENEIDTPSSGRRLDTVEEGKDEGLSVRPTRADMRRQSMGLRPLPSSDPTENPEERANRIRSFYKEYFDESRPEPAGGYQYNRAVYQDDYTQEHMGDPVNLDQYAKPRAEFMRPTQRRAMTPPPRAPPRYMSRPGTAARGRSSSGSMGRPPYIPPRGMSSMSGRVGPNKIHNLPPPQPLSSLPTPGKLTEESLVFMPIDFAPPVSFRDRQAGRGADSPRGSKRPYSPAVRPFIPLATTMDDLAPVPSPHALRKSGTFTALDFAPPPRIFRNNENSFSDTGSNRSGHSGRSTPMSNSAVYAVRSGANRVSRLPVEMVGTMEDLNKSLRPTMDMRNMV